MSDTLDARMPRMRDRHPMSAPPRAAQPHPHTTTTSGDPEPRVRWERAGADCYAVLFDSTLIGFIDVAGRVFVALVGRRYDQAMEVGQSVVFAKAVDAVVAAVRPGYLR